MVLTQAAIHPRGQRIWRCLDSALPGLSVLLPFANYAGAFRLAAQHHFATGVAWPNILYCAVPVTLWFIWRGTREGRLWAFTAHMVIGASLFNPTVLRIMFGGEFSHRIYQVYSGPDFGFVNFNLAMAFMAVSFYCLLRICFQTSMMGESWKGLSMGPALSLGKRKS